MGKKCGMKMAWSTCQMSKESSIIYLYIIYLNPITSENFRLDQIKTNFRRHFKKH